MPQQNQIHIDQALTNISIAYTNEDYIADMVLPSINVDKRSDKYFVYGKENLRVKNSVVRPGAIPDELEYSLSTGNYLAEMRGRRHLVLDEERQAADNPLSPEIDAAEILAAAVLLSREWETAQYLTSSATLPNYTALSGTSQWSDYTNSTPLTNIKTAKASVRLQSLRRANWIMIPYETSLTLAEHPSIKDLIKYTDPNALTESGLPPVIRGLRVVEPGGAYDASVEGRAFSGQTIWGKNVIVGYTSPNAGLKTMSLGYTFVAPDATTGARGLSSRIYRAEDRRGDFVESSITYDMRIIAVGAAYLFQTVIP